VSFGFVAEAYDGFMGLYSPLLYGHVAGLASAA